MIVLPAQAIASAINSSCGPSHHKLSPVTTSANHHVHQAMDNLAGHDHGHFPVHHAASDSQLNDKELNSAPEPTQFKNSSCSACASCCIGAFAPPIVVNWHSDLGTSPAPLVVESPLIAGHIPPGLERPPRSFFA